MAQISAKLCSLEGGRIAFWCPGCEEMHEVSVDGPGAVWGWDRNVDLPTFTPSILITGGHYMSGWTGPNCWCTYNATHKPPAPFKCQRCHTFVTAGRIQFLSDCSHALAGQTVDLPDLPDLEQS